jgi:NAD(P)-dependent dehydrogenase (short-subunit alcohol dehydrogenase family)
MEQRGSRGMEGKGVLVTGASAGLGRALSLALARRGARVAMVARHPAPLEAAVESIRAQGFEAHAVPGDVGDKNAIHRIALAATSLVGPIEVLVHAASTLGALPMPLLLDTECEDLARVLEVNLVGPFRLTKVIASAMAVHGRGVVVSLSSDAATNAYPGWGAYGLSKAALDHLSRSFAAELGELGVRFFSVDPGEMDTAMHRDAFGAAHDPSVLADPADVAEKITIMILDRDQAPNGARLLVSS